MQFNKLITLYDFTRVKSRFPPFSNSTPRAFFHLSGWYPSLIACCMIEVIRWLSHCQNIRKIPKLSLSGPGALAEDWVFSA